MRKVSTDQGPIETDADCPDFARLVASLTRRGPGRIEFVRLEHPSGGVLTLGAKTSRDGERLLRFRHVVPDGTILCTKRVAERGKLVNQLAHFFEAGARGDYLDWIPTKSLLFDAEEATSRLHPLSSLWSPSPNFQASTAASMQGHRTNSLERSRPWQENTRVKFGVRVFGIGLVSLILCTFAFGILFQPVSIRKPATEIEIIGLSDRKELSQYLRLPAFASEFSNLVVSTEQLALAAELISARDKKLKGLANLYGYELVQQHPEAAREQAAELTNILASISLKFDQLDKMPRPEIRSEPRAQIVLPAKDIARLAGLGYWDALRLKDKMNREPADSYSSSPADRERSKLENELYELRSKSSRLQTEVRTNAAISVSKSYAQKLALLGVNTDSDVLNLNQTTKQNISALERRLVAECRNRSLVFQSPLSEGTVFASSMAQCFIVFRPARQGGRAEIVSCGTLQHEELLFDFLKREFPAREYVRKLENEIQSQEATAPIAANSPSKTIIGSTAQEVEGLLNGWATRKSNRWTAARPIVYYIKDVEIIVSYRDGKAVGVAVIDKPGSGISPIPPSRFTQLVALIGGQPKTNDVSRDASGIREFSVGDVD